MNKTDEELKAEWLARNGVTVCNPVDLRGDRHKEVVRLLQSKNPATVNVKRSDRQKNKSQFWRRWDDNG
jgi:hypothetical protein